MSGWLRKLFGRGSYPLVAPFKLGEPVVLSEEEHERAQSALEYILRQPGFGDRLLSQEEAAHVHAAVIAIELTHVARQQLENGLLREAALSCVKALAIAGAHYGGPWILLARVHQEHGDRGLAGRIMMYGAQVTKAPDRYASTQPSAEQIAEIEGLLRDYHQTR